MGTHRRLERLSKVFGVCVLQCDYVSFPAQIEVVVVFFVGQDPDHVVFAHVVEAVHFQDLFQGSFGFHVDYIGRYLALNRFADQDIEIRCIGEHSHGIHHGQLVQLNTDPRALGVDSVRGVSARYPDRPQSQKAPETAETTRASGIRAHKRIILWVKREFHSPS